MHSGVERRDEERLFMSTHTKQINVFVFFKTLQHVVPEQANVNNAALHNLINET